MGSWSGVLTGAKVPVKMGGPGEFGGTMGTQLGLGQDGDVASVAAHFGGRAVFLSEFRGEGGVHGGRTGRAT